MPIRTCNQRWDELQGHGCVLTGRGYIARRLRVDRLTATPKKAKNKETWLKARPPPRKAVPFDHRSRKLWLRQASRVFHDKETQHLGMPDLEGWPSG